MNPVNPYWANARTNELLLGYWPSYPNDMTSLTTKRIESQPVPPAFAWLRGKSMQPHGQQGVPLRPVALGQSPPRDRPEQQLAGYRSALSEIISRKLYVALSSEVIRKFDRFAHGSSSGNGGQYEERCPASGYHGPVRPFTLSEIFALDPTASPQLLKKVLLALKKEGIVKLTG